jgi:hypothetical protein
MRLYMQKDALSFSGTGNASQSLSFQAVASLLELDIARGEKSDRAGRSLALPPCLVEEFDVRDAIALGEAWRNMSAYDGSDWSDGAH